MIRYALVCDAGHAFDSWFRDSSAFDELAEAGQVACPACRSVSVHKALMAPSIVTANRKGTSPEVVASTADARSAAPMALLDDGQRKLRDVLRDMHRKVVENADNVGRAFPDEARKMHDGEVPHRSIYGEATGEEVKALLEEGVPLLPMPVLPDDHH